MQESRKDKIHSKVLQACKIGDFEKFKSLLEDLQVDISTKEITHSLMLSAIHYRQAEIYHYLQDKSGQFLNEETQANLLFRSREIKNLLFLIQEINLNANAKINNKNLLEHLLTTNIKKDEEEFFMRAVKLLLDVGATLTKSRYHQILLQRLIFRRRADLLSLFFSKMKENFDPQQCEFIALFKGDAKYINFSMLAVAHLLIQNDIVVPEHLRGNLLKSAVLNNEKVLINAYKEKGLLLSPATNAKSLYLELAKIEDKDKKKEKAKRIKLATILLTHQIPLVAERDLPYLIDLAIAYRHEGLMRLIKDCYEAITNSEVKARFLHSDHYRNLIIKYAATSYCLVPLKLTHHLPSSLNYGILEKIFLCSLDSGEKDTSLLIISKHASHRLALRTAAVKRLKFKPQLAPIIQNIFPQDNFSTHKAGVKLFLSFKRKHQVTAESDEGNSSTQNAEGLGIFSKKMRLEESAANKPDQENTQLKLGYSSSNEEN